MRRFWFGLISLACAAGAAFAGCGDVPDEPTGPTTTGAIGGGPPGAGGNDGGPPGTGGSGSCVVPSDCGKDLDCVVRTCLSGACGVADVPQDLPATTQVPGDCTKKLCDGSGTVTSAPDDGDLPDDGTACTVDSCLNGVPVFTPVGAGAPCADHGGKLCDAAGACVVCLGPADCASGVCSQGACLDPTCTDHVRNGGETDTDCGGPSCPGCLAGKTCATGPDCHDGVCTGGLCQLPTCADHVKNASETGVDCGGGTCPGCKAGGACFVPGDCASGTCTAGVCG